MRTRQIPGLSLAVVKSGRIIKAKGYGLASVELNVPATEGTVYQLASATKSFTATAIMLLVEDGKVNLEDSITKYLSELPESWSRITVRQLLTHTSGIQDYLRAPNVVWERDYKADEIIKLVAGLPLSFQPGERWEYSNTGYVLLAVIIQKVSGNSYDQFLAERVYKPLAMNATRRDDPSAVIRERAAGYQLENKTLRNAEHLNPTLWNNGDGGLLSTVLDLAKWDAALYAGKLFKMSSFEQMWTPVKLSNGYDAHTMFDNGYGFGWFLDHYRGHRVIEHSGGRPGAVSTITRFVNDKLTVIILANCDGWNPRGIARCVAGIYDRSLLPPSLMKRQPDTDPQATQRIKQALSDWANGVKDSPLMTPGERAFITTEGDAELAGWLKNLKAFTCIASDKVEDKQIEYNGAHISQIRYCKLDAGDTVRYFTCFLTAESKIALFQSSKE